jgi:hypothetical protein
MYTLRHAPPGLSSRGLHHASGLSSCGLPLRLYVAVGRVGGGGGGGGLTRPTLGLSCELSMNLKARNISELCTVVE